MDGQPLRALAGARLIRQPARCFPRSCWPPRRRSKSPERPPKNSSRQSSTTAPSSAWWPTIVVANQPDPARPRSASARRLTESSPRRRNACARAVSGTAEQRTADRIHRAGGIARRRSEDRCTDSGSPRPRARSGATVKTRAKDKTLAKRRNRRERGRRRAKNTGLKKKPQRTQRAQSCFFSACSALSAVSLCQRSVLIDHAHHTKRAPTRPVRGARIAVGCWNAAPVLKLIVSAA